MTDNLKVPCEVYSRVVGYLRPVQSWHAGKKQEFKDRVVFDVTKALPEGKKKEEEKDEAV